MLGPRPLCFAALLLGLTAPDCSPAFADDVQSPAEATGGPGGPVSGGLLKWFDRDGNGRLDDEERQTGAAEMIKRFDHNGNARLDPDELTAALVQLGARRPTAQRSEPGSLQRRLRERFDEDHDGQLDVSERKTALKQLSRAATDRTTNRLRTELLRRFDADGNGRLDGAELDDFLDPPANEAAAKKKNANRQTDRSAESERGN
jgi:Ca2+-binding EF-hand superfamily protein